jgi:hypothetical protein
MDREQRSLPFMGTMTLEILQASQTSLHGDVYFDLLVNEAGEVGGEPFSVRVARGACTVQPVPGAMIRATFLSGQIERITPAG